MMSLLSGPTLVVGKLVARYLLPNIPHNRLNGVKREP